MAEEKEEKLYDRLRAIRMKNKLKTLYDPLAKLLQAAGAQVSLGMGEPVLWLNAVFHDY